MKNIIFFCLFFMAFTLACSPAKGRLNGPRVPQSWYRLPENQSSGPNVPSSQDEEAKLKKLSNNLKAIFNANTVALNRSGLGNVQNFNPEGLLDIPKGMPSDWVPWRPEVFCTDLTLSVDGLLGSLLTKGSPTVRAYWRKQGAAAHSEMMSSFESEGEPHTIQIQEESGIEEILKQLDPAIRAAAATGKIKDTPELRDQILSAAQEFQLVTKVIPSSDPDLPWWVQRFRLDINVDGSGKVTSVGSVGGEVRFRFEWHRIKKRQPSQLIGRALSLRELKMRDSLLDFITDTANDLESAFDGVSAQGFQAHTMRMGVGISAKGNIGIVKGSAGIVGQIYFTRNVKRPVVRPALTKALSNRPLFLIERDPSSDHLRFADRQKIPYELSTLSEDISATEAVYKMDREAFRKGLKKAAKISEFIAENAVTPKSEGWKVYELRTSFDASIGGELDLVTLAGAVTAQIAFFNRNF